MKKLCLMAVLAVVALCCIPAASGQRIDVYSGGKVTSLQGTWKQDVGGQNP